MFVGCGSLSNPGAAVQGQPPTWRSENWYGFPGVQNARKVDESQIRRGCNQTSTLPDASLLRTRHRERAGANHRAPLAEAKAVVTSQPGDFVPWRMKGPEAQCQNHAKYGKARSHPRTVFSLLRCSIRGSRDVSASLDGKGNSTRAAGYSPQKAQSEPHIRRANPMALFSLPEARRLPCPGAAPA